MGADAWAGVVGQKAEVGACTRKSFGTRSRLICRYSRRERGSCRKGECAEEGCRRSPVLRSGILAMISFVRVVQRRSFLLDFGCVAEYGVEVGIASGEEKRRRGEEEKRKNRKGRR